MPKFLRSFPVESLKIWDAAHPGNTVRVLFDHWCLPGKPASEKASLRIAIRGRYLNFYIKGQSAAKLSFPNNEPRLDIAKAYVSGLEKTSKRSSPGCKPASFDGQTLAQPETAVLVEKWIKTAETYASAEKRFVDDLIAANPGIIDVEMTLPASDIPGGVKVAPRMDIVMAQVVQNESISIAFWEAKCADNKEVRAKGDDVMPRVIDQINKYVGWMVQPGRIEEVQEAYRNNAAILLELFDVFREDDLYPCRRIWQALAKSDQPAIIPQPGLVIGNYWPGGSADEAACKKLTNSAASFEANGHRAKLQREKIAVHEVGADRAGRALPVLTA